MGQAQAKYPPQLRDHLFAVGALSPQSRVLNLAAGDGQLAMLIAQVADSVIAMDDDVDVSQASIQATSAHAAVQWVQGGDRDLGRVVTEAIDLVLIGSGFSDMDQASLLENLDLLVSDKGAVVICSAGAPVWLQDKDWARALRKTLTTNLGLPDINADSSSHETDQQVLADSAFSHVVEWFFERNSIRSIASVVDEVLLGFASNLDDSSGEVLTGCLTPFADGYNVTESVRTTAVIGRRQASNGIS